MDFYLRTQLLPPLTRLCATIPELTASELGVALGFEVIMPAQT